MSALIDLQAPIARSSAYRVRAIVPHQPSETFTAIAAGPASAVSAVKRHLAGSRDLTGARFACRSGGDA